MREEPRAHRRARYGRHYLPVADDAPAGLESGPDAPRVLYRPLTVAEAADLDAALSALRLAPDREAQLDATRALEEVYTRQIVGVEGAIDHYAGDVGALGRAQDGAQIWRALDNRDGAALVRALMGLLSVAEGNG
jgi:hypothetical protein